MNRREFLSRSVLGGGFCAAMRLGAEHRFAPYVIGANTAISGYGLYQAIGLIHRLGFPTIEIQNLVGVPEPVRGEFPGFRLDRISDGEMRRIKEALAGFQHVTTHLPYTGFEYFSPDERANEAIRTLEMTMRATSALGAKIAVMHPKPGPGMSLVETWPIMIRRIRAWGDIARDHGFRLALETGYPKSVRDFVRLVSEVDHDHVGATLDVGHQAGYEELAARVRPTERGTATGKRAYNDINLELVEQLGPKLFHLHVHDIEPSTWKEHQPLVYGFIDYPRLISKLQDIGYGGVLVFEIGGPAEAVPSHLAEAKRKLEGYLSRVQPRRSGA